MMNLKEFKEHIDHQYAVARYPEQTKVCVEVYRVGSVGATPAVEIINAYSGFDWDSGKFILTTEENLREIDRDEIAALNKQYTELGWKHYEIRNLKSELASYKKKYEALKIKMDGLDK